MAGHEWCDMQWCGVCVGTGARSWRIGSGGAKGLGISSVRRGSGGSIKGGSRYDDDAGTESVYGSEAGYSDHRYMCRQ